MLSLSKTWQCDIWPDRVRLHHGKPLPTQYLRKENEPLAALIGRVLDDRQASFSRRDKITFLLDTPALIYHIQPWSAAIRQPHELRQLAQGTRPPTALPGPWQLCFEHASWQQPALVASLQQSFQETLAGAARQHRLRFRGVVTPFQRLLSHCPQPLPAEGLFVCLGPQHCRIASRRHHQWQGACLLALPPQALAAQLRIIARLCHFNGDTCYVLDTLSGQFSECSLRPEGP